MANQDPNGFLLDNIVLSEEDLKGGITQQQREKLNCPQVNCFLTQRLIA